MSRFVNGAGAGRIFHAKFGRLHRTLVNAIAITAMSGVVLAAAAPAESPGITAREQAQNYFEDDQPRKAVAVLAEAARHDPADRVLGSMFYAALRNHVWYPPQTLPIRHGGPVQVLAFTDDALKLACGTATGEVSVSPTDALDAAKAAAARIDLPKESGAILGLAFTNDGTKLAVVSKGGGLRLWDLATKKVVFEMAKPGQEVTAFSKAVAAGVVAFGTADGGIHVADIENAKIIAEGSQPGGAVNAISVSRLAGKVAAACADHTVRLWDLASKSAVGSGLAHHGPVLAVDFSVDERYVLTAGEEKIARLWDPYAGVLVMPAMACGAKILKARVSGDGSMISTMLDDGSVLLWDALTGARLDFNLREDAPLNDFIWTRGGLRSASASSDGHATIWTMLHGTRRGEVIPLGSPALVVALNLNAKLLATGTQDGEARLWRTDEGAPLTTVRHHSARARTAFYSADGNHLVTTSEDHTALHWVSGKVQPFGPALRHAGKVTCGVFNHDATRILTSDETGRVQLWNAENGRPEGNPFPHSAPVNWVDFYPTGDRFVTASGPNAAVWNVGQRDKPLAVITHPGKKKSELKSVRFSPNGRWLVSASTDGTARIWDAETYKQVAVIDRHDPVWCARFSPDSSRLVVTGADAQAVVYDTATWKPVGTPILASGTVFSAAITEDNRFLVISSFLLDAVQFYEIATGRALGEGLNIHSQATSVDYLLQDKVVVVACDDGSVRAVESPFVGQDVPAWMCDFAEHLIGLRQTGPDKFERVDSQAAQLQAEAATAGESNDDFPRLARWLMATGSTRHGMPRFTSTLSENIIQRVNEHSIDSLFECYDAVSSDALVVSALSLYLPNARQGEVLADLVFKMTNPDPLARCYAASTLINAGRKNEARDALNKAVADAPENPRVLRRAAKLEARLLNTKDAVEHFEKSIRLAPNDYETHRAYGWALYHLHQPAAASTQFLLAEELVGDMADDVIAGLCLSAAAQGNKTEAVAAYRRLIDLDPQWRDAKYIVGQRGWVQDELTALELVRQAALAKNKK